MNRKLKGIVLHNIKHKDNSQILYLYTNKFGRRTYVLKTNNKSRTPRGIFPLSVLEFETQVRQTANMPLIKEYLHLMLPSLITDVRKCAISLFIGELLYKLLQEEEPNEALFDFIYHSICLFDALEGGAANFHIHFMVQLARYLGFSMPDNRFERSYFDIKTCEFVGTEPRHPQFLNKQESGLLTSLLTCPASELDQLELHGELRYQFSCKMVEFYAHHFDRVLPIRSLAILHELFSV